MMLGSRTGPPSWTNIFRMATAAMVTRVSGYLAAQTLVQVLKQCGDDLTRENVMKQAANLKDLRLDMLLPGISINTSATDFYPIKHMQMYKFDGEHWEAIGPVMSGESAGDRGQTYRPTRADNAVRLTKH